DVTQRDPAGYVTTDIHTFSTSGSALATEPAELDSPGVGWLYSSVLLGDVRIRVTPANADSALFVGIGPADEVDRYLAGVSHTVIWTSGRTAWRPSDAARPDRLPQRRISGSLPRPAHAP